MTDPFAVAGSVHDTTVDFAATVAATAVGAHGATAGASTASNRLGVRVSNCRAAKYVTALHVEFCFNQFHASVGVVVVTVVVCKYRATAPLTCGAAMDVPDSARKVLANDEDFGQAETTESPGAKMSTQSPKFDHAVSASLALIAPTEIVPGVPAGVVLQADLAEFPDAATTTMPSAIKFLIAVSIVVAETSKPMLMFTTARSPS
jgi:hypothetical protein